MGETAMLTPDSHLNTLWATTLLNALAHGGVRHLCLSPGYRHTPLVLALEEVPLITPFVHFDERATAFHALGLAKGKNEPVALLSTSGTAAGNLLPAIMEADRDHCPLVVLTADRPPELRNVGANQTTHQVNLYQNFVRYAVDLPCPTEAISPRFLKQEVAAALFAARGPDPGPVHLNWMLRKPFFKAPHPASCSEVAPPCALQGKLHLPRATTDALAAQLSAQPRGVIIAGRLPLTTSPSRVLELATQLKWPIFPDILSPLRLYSDHPLVLSYYELLIKKAPVAPTAFLHIGKPFMSAPLYDWLEASAPSLYVHLSPYPARCDPLHRVTHRIQADIDAVCMALAEALPSPPLHSPWLHAWQHRHRALQTTLDCYFKTTSIFSQPHLFHRLSSSLNQPPLFIANSTPIRHANAFYTPTQTAGPLFANRGLSGIDGNISTVIGLTRALASPCTAILGDLAFLHDLTSLAQAKESAFPITWVVINNNGGAIFAELGLREATSLYSRCFVAPHHLNFAAIATFFSLEYHQVSDETALFSLLNTPLLRSTLIEARIPVENDLLTTNELLSLATGSAPLSPT